MTYKTRTNNSKDNWETPKWLYELLNDRFSFTVDAACSRDNDKVRCVTQETDGTMFLGFKDGLKESWAGHRVFCNPPFSDKKKWIEKAYEEIFIGDCPLCIMILPCNPEYKPFVELLKYNCHWETLDFRVSFIDPKTKKPISGNTTGTIIAYIWGHINKPSSRSREDGKKEEL